MKQLKLLAILFITFFNAQHVTAQWVWADVLNNGTSGYMNILSSATDASGNVYMGGNYYQGANFGTIYFPVNSQQCFFLTKVDPNGTILWAKHFGGVHGGQLTSISTDAAGNVFIAGGFNDSALQLGSVTLRNWLPGSFNNNMFIAKLDPSGNTIWAEDAIANGVNSIKTDASGNVIVAGSYQVGAAPTFGTITIPIGLVSPMFIVKYNSSGSVVWAKSQNYITVPGPPYNILVTGGLLATPSARCLTTDASGNFFIYGTYSGTFTIGTTTLNSRMGSTDLCLIKYNSAGNVLWAKSIGGTWGETTNDIATDASGNVFISGSTNSLICGFDGDSVVNFGGCSNGQPFYEQFIAKYDATGNVLWVNIGRHHCNPVNFIVTDALGNVYLLVSYPYFPSYYSGGGSSLTNPYLEKYSPTGTLLWGVHPTELYGASLAIDATGNLFIMGGFDSVMLTLNSSFRLINSTYLKDWYIAKYNGAGNYTPIITNENSKLVLYPNPTSDEITIKCNKPEDISTIQIYDMLGRQVYDYQPQAVVDQSINIKLPPTLSDGMYYLRIMGSNNSGCVRFVVKR